MKSKHYYLVIGYYEEDGQRWADSYWADTPEEAEALAKQGYPGIAVAGVVELVDGEMQVVA